MIGIVLECNEDNCKPTICLALTQELIDSMNKLKLLKNEAPSLLTAAMQNLSKLPIAKMTEIQAFSQSELYPATWKAIEIVYDLQGQSLT